MAVAAAVVVGAGMRRRISGRWGHGIVARTGRTGLPSGRAATPAARHAAAASFYTPEMARWSCAACGAMIDDLFGACTACRELRPIEGGWPDGPTLVLLYPGDTQVDAAEPVPLPRLAALLPRLRPRHDELGPGASRGQLRVLLRQPGGGVPHRDPPRDVRPGTSSVTVAAVILAARPESALRDVEGVANARRLVDTAWAGGATPVVVVAADPDGAVAAALAGSPAILAAPPAAAGGPVDQICRGIDVARADVDGTDAALVWPARMGWVDAETVTSLVEAHGADRATVLRPAFGGVAGWPALVPVAHLEVLRGLATALAPGGSPRGARDSRRRAARRGRRPRHRPRPRHASGRPPPVRGTAGAAGREPPRVGLARRGGARRAARAAADVR